MQLRCKGNFKKFCGQQLSDIPEIGLLNLNRMNHGKNNNGR